MRVRPVLSQYFDIGDCDCVCKFCGAYFWLSEKSMKLSAPHRPRYSRCCKSGDVILPYTSKLPPEYMSLFRNDSFLRDIRAYNSMFSMTSFRDNVDDEVNDSCCPYVFKISGQISHRIGSLSPDAVKGPRFLQLYLYDTDNEVQNKLISFQNPRTNVLDEGIVRVLVSFLRNNNAYVRIFKTAK
ncbi:unnamed protein product [Lactuca saligna]|uniref:Helitron helicase-like domain-containing protein n=1 Tax=Lactuca saligna TaxID=75948 RepID=A0AA35YMW6_LACSI|nr:unnamed protein product [Lactuca saligna]